jgi:hypothetical protein
MLDFGLIFSTQKPGSSMYRIVGFAGCGYHQRAVEAATAAGAAADVVELPDRRAFQQYLKRADVAPLLRAHRTSPAVFLLPATAGAADAASASSASSAAPSSFVGGCDALLARLGTVAAADTSSRSPAGVLSYFEQMQREKSFVVWVLWRGIW